MELLAALWLPILVAGAAVWFYGAIAWMVLPHHANDWKGAPDENALVAAIRQLGLQPGTYGFPHCTTKAEKNSPEFQKKWKEGPSGVLNVWNPNINMGKNMALTFLFNLAVSFLIAYVGSVAISRGATFGHVMQVLGTVGVLAYSAASIPNAIWFQTPKNAIVSCLIDGVVSGLITGAVFAALWPKATIALPG